MQTTLMNRAVAGAIGAAALLLAGAAQAALQDRDLNGDTVVDAFYDTDLDITWLRDANVNGAMNWDTAVAWADNFSFGKTSDWRLPTSDTCYGDNCAGSEMGHLWYTELGNSAGAMTNPGGFEHIGSFIHWSGTEFASDPRFAWNISTENGSQWANWQNGKLDELYAMAVRDGDVAVVPEPQTYALLLLGLTGLAALTRRHPR